MTDAAHGRDVYHHALVSNGAKSVGLCLGIDFGHLAGARDLVLGGRVYFVGEIDLARMNRPFTDEAEDRGPGRLAPVTLRVMEVGERTVDRIDSRRPCRDHDLVARVMPHVARIACGAFGRKPHALRSAEVAGAENDRFKARRAARDLLDID